MVGVIINTSNLTIHDVDVQKCLKVDILFEGGEVRGGKTTVVVGIYTVQWYGEVHMQYRFYLEVCSVPA